MAFWFTEIQQTELPLRLEVTKEVWALQVLGTCPEHTWLPRQRFTSWPISFIISHTKWFQEKGTCWNIFVLFLTKHKESDQQSFQGKQSPSKQCFKNGGSPFSLKRNTWFNICSILFKMKSNISVMDKFIPVTKSYEVTEAIIFNLFHPL